MCGIAGHISFVGRPDVEALRAMTGRIVHRGPDNQDVWHRDEAALGHARLSVIDLSEANNQPMLDPLTGNVMVFNGEIYNFQSLRASLEKKGERFRTKGDTEVLLGLYRCHGINFLSMLRGMFAFALWDPSNKMLFMARDPLGKKPLAYAQTEQGLVFASEVGALSGHPLVSSDMDCEALTHYLSLSYIPSPFSIYQSIRKLPPGHFAICDADGLRMQRYFELDYRSKDKVGLDEAVHMVHEELRRAVRLRMISDVPLGAMLSGGLDSSLIAAIMAEQADGPVKTFSVGFDDKKYNELPHAREVAEHLGLDHHEEIARPDALASLPGIVAHYGEPYADNSALPSFILSGMVRKHVTVALNGDGGDELSGGYSHYRRKGLAHLVQGVARSGKFVPGAGIEALLEGDSLLCRARRSWVYRYKYPELKPLYRSEYFQGAGKAGLLRPEVAEVVGGRTSRWRKECIQEAFAHADNTIERMLWLDNTTYLPGDLLVKMDIASMAHSLEVRSPLLDSRMVGLCARLPAEYKVRKGVRKYILKAIARKYLPAHIINRRKQGFSVPVSSWLRGPMAVFLEQSLEEAAPRMGRYLNMDTVRELVVRHKEGGANHGMRLWILLNLALWETGRE